MYRIAADVGGTFTDVIAVDDAGKVTFVKVTSTPHDQSIGVMTGLGRLATELGMELSTLLPQTERVMHA